MFFIFVLSFTIALTPDPVVNLTASVNTHKPAVTLNWDPPANAGYPGDVTKYQVRFRNKEKGCYNESAVNGSTTTIVITRESGLRPLTENTFEVRACSGDDASQKWMTVSAFVGMQSFIVYFCIQFIFMYSYSFFGTFGNSACSFAKLTNAHSITKYDNRMHALYKLIVL